MYVRPETTLFLKSTMTTLCPYISDLSSTKSPYLILAHSTALNQMPCQPVVGDPHAPFDTPGPLLDKTKHQKIYAVALFLKAAWPKYDHLGLDNTPWQPFKSMVDLLPQQFVMAKDPVPLDQTQPKKKCCRWPWIGRHQKIIKSIWQPTQFTYHQE